MKLTKELASWYDGKTIIDNNNREFFFSMTELINENREITNIEFNVIAYVNDKVNHELSSVHMVGDTIDSNVSWAIPF